MSKKDLIEAYRVKKEEELLTLKKMLGDCMQNPSKAYVFMQNYRDHAEDKMWNSSGIDNAELNKRAQELHLENDQDFQKLKNQYQAKLDQIHIDFQKEVKDKKND